MSTLVSRDIPYSDGEAGMIGYFCRPDSPAPLPGIVMLHGAHGLNDFIMGCANQLAEAGFAVLAADLWGGRKQPGHPDEIGPMLGQMLSNRAIWQARMQAACTALSAQDGVVAGRMGMVGYCFGGASALEFLRMGAPLNAVVSLHGGLDMVADDWSGATASPDVFIATGSADPMAKPGDLARVQAGLSAAGIRWDTHVYGDVKHAFTEPDGPGRPPFAAYDARADRRSRAAMLAVFNESLKD
ncbi:dienelactone hydrolase family protein [Donghicola mangrovi]|uniref:Dienelactone hydrolase domain-containing protein n=1 Tax=Donghicola mangrovi TaxID=2729614 RepID=A0A850Q9I4_9RHOB|nr:dienelactone hydrolase family protein [Donghicola mangrovi]NVO25564.1 hypothetical protein [Donghicola mangrovi]